MESILTPSELDALLKPTRERATPSVRPIDLVARDHQAFAMLPELQRAADRMATAVGRLCTQLLRAPCKVAADPLEVVPGSRLPDLLSAPRFAYAVGIKEVPNAGLICIDGMLGGAFVSSQFGGQAQLEPQPATPPTGTERRTVARLGDQLLTTLNKALANVVPLEARLAPEVVAPLTQASGAQAVLLLSLRIAVGDQRCSIIVSLDTSAPGLKITRQPPTIKGTQRLGYNLQQVSVGVRATLGRSTITVRDFLNLAVGDLLTLGTPVDAQIPLLIEGRPKFSGKPVVTRGSLGLEISVSAAKSVKGKKE